MPVTQDGQIIAAVVVFIALGLWGFASANLTRIWLHIREDWTKVEVDALFHELSAIHDEVARLRELLREAQPAASEDPQTMPTGGMTQ